MNFPQTKLKLTLCSKNIFLLTYDLVRSSSGCLLGSRPSTLLTSTITKPQMIQVLSVTAVTQGSVCYLCSVGSGSESCSGSLVLGITPMMVLFREVPRSSRWLTSCMFRGESTLKRTVEPGSSTPSWLSSSGRRFGICIPPSEAMLYFLGHCSWHNTWK